MQILRFPFSNATQHDTLPWLHAFTMPVNAQIVAFEILPDGPSLYALCDPHEPAHTRYIAAPATGQELPAEFDMEDGGYRHLGTRQYQAASKPGRVQIMHAFEVPHRLAFVRG